MGSDGSTEKEDLVREYYEKDFADDGGGLRVKIQQGLAAMGKSLTGTNNSEQSSVSSSSTQLLQPLDLAPVDEFHSRGHQATLDLCNMVTGGIRCSDSIVDVGCGLGGTARHLASTHGATVTGIDLSQGYVDVGNELTRHVGLDDKVRLVQGSALNLPLSYDTFDLAFTVHAQMNVADKTAFYREIHRVLRPGGRLMFHDVFRGDAKESPRYPCPWADTENLSYLVTEAKAREIMESTGFVVSSWIDQTPQTVAWFQSTVSKMAKLGRSPPLGIHLVMGETTKQKIQNHLSNCERGSTVVVMGVLTKHSTACSNLETKKTDTCQTSTPT